jgi:hypothetical protein
MEGRAGLVSLAAALIILLVCTALIISCGGRDRRAADGTKKTTGAEAMPDSLAAEVKLNEGGYAMGEPVVMTLGVTNTSDNAITLTFPSAQRYDFIVKKGKQPVWQWSGGRMFAQVIGRYELPPGESISYEYTWDQTAADGTKPSLGAYTVEGLLMISPPLRTESRTFGIVD